MRYIISLVMYVGLVYAGDFTMPQFNEDFMRKAFLQTSKVDLGGVLQCENVSGKNISKNLKNLNKVAYNTKAETKALQKSF